jgi:hypothetical protein
MPAGIDPDGTREAASVAARETHRILAETEKMLDDAAGEWRLACPSGCEVADADDRERGSISSLATVPRLGNCPIDISDGAQEARGELPAARCGVPPPWLFKRHDERPKRAECA